MTIQPTEIDDQLAELNRKHDKQIDHRIEEFAAAIAALLLLWRSKIHGLLVALPSSRGVSRFFEYRHLQRQLTQQLAEIRYSALAFEYISNYAEQEDFLRAELALVTDVSSDVFAGDALRTLREIDYDSLIRAGNVTADSVAQAISQGSITGLTDDEIKATIDRLLRDFGRISTGFATTGVLFYSRFLSRSGFEPYTDYWLDFGPEDEKNRPFCAAHVNKVFTAEEIDKMDNGFNAPYDDVWLYVGGIGCRHRWVPWFGKITKPRS